MQEQVNCSRWNVPDIEQTLVADVDGLVVQHLVWEHPERGEIPHGAELTPHRTTVDRESTVIVRLAVVMGVGYWAGSLRDQRVIVDGGWLRSATSLAVSRIHGHEQVRRPEGGAGMGASTRVEWAGDLEGWRSEL